LDRKPKALSGGQRQRVAVGRAIVREPAAFLFDEPLSNLDAKLRVTTRAELKRLHHRLKTTTIYVTHDQEEAMTLGDRIVVMKDGKIQQSDAPLQMYGAPVNRFVAGFIGMPPMNFFDGAIKMVDGQMMFEEGRLENARVAGGADDELTSGDEPVVLVGELTLPGNGFRLPVPARLRDRLAGQVGRHVVLGVRPEHLHARPTASERDCCRDRAAGQQHGRLRRDRIKGTCRRSARSAGRPAGGLGNDFIR
jgi:multiple sugar transport system ATP-binding protein